MSSFSSRVFLYAWYAVLVVALVVQSNVRLQWSSRNFCGAAEEVSVYHLEQWNSSACLRWEAYWVRSAYTRSWSQDYLPQLQPQSQQGSLAGGREGASRTSASAGGGSDRYRYVTWPPADGVLDTDSARSSCRGVDAVGFSKQLLPPRLPQRARETSSASVRQRAALPSLSLGCSSGTSTASSASSLIMSPAPPPGPTMPPLRLVYKLRWTAQALSGVLDHQLNRYLHIFVSLASPLAMHTAASSARAAWRTSVSQSPRGVSQRVYDVLVALEETSLAPDGDDSGSSSSSSNGDSGSAHNESKYVYTYRASVTCRSDAPRCSNIVLPSSVVIPANDSQLTLTLIDVDAELAEASLPSAMVGHAGDVGLPWVPASRLLTREGALAGVADSPCMHRAPSWQHAPLTSSATTTSSPSSAVGVMYQRSRYTIGTLVFRYVFLIVTLLSMLRFLYRSQHAHELQFEQKWTLTAQIGLIGYLNPVYWWCIYAGEGARRGGASHRNPAPVSALAGFLHRLPRFALYYIEFHVPTYFAALIVCYVWSVIAGSFRWHLPRTTAVAPAGAAESALHPSAATRIPSPAASTQEDDPHPSLRGSAESAADGSAEAGARAVPSSKIARFRVRVLLSTFLTLVTSLDMIKCYLEEEGVGGSELTCKSPMCLRIDKCIGYLLLCGILSSGMGLYWLRRNLARHPYLSTRPQQLACRIMIFMYFTGGIYTVLQVALLDALYAQLLGVIYYQPLIQLPHLLVLTSLVNHMTYVYTTTKSSRQIPLRPNDPRWKRVGWSSRWYRWLSWHGGSLYVFFSEAEERMFYEVQVTSQIAKHTRKMEKRKRKENKKRRETATARAVEGVKGGGDADGGRCTRLPLPPLDASASAAAAAATAPSMEGGEAVEDAAFAHSPRDERRWLLPQDMPGCLRTLPITTARPCTSSGDRETHAGGVDDDDDEKNSTHNSSRSPSTGRSLSCEDEPATIAAAHNPGVVLPGGGPEARDVPALPQPLAAPGAAGATAGDSDHLTQSGRDSRHALRRVSNRMLDALHRAESRLVDGTATFLDFLEETCVDRPLHALLQQRARQSFVFFNLETAIDCLNLSCEAYAVRESRGDEFIRTGIQVSATEMPRAALGLAERAAMMLLGLCFKPSPHANPALDDSAEDDVAVAVSPTPGDDREPLLGERRTSPSSSPARATCGAEVASSAIRTDQTAVADPPDGGTNAGSSSWQPFLRYPVRATSAALKYFGGSSPPSGVGAAAAATSSDASPSMGTASLPPLASAANARTSVDAARLPRMNVEQYGYHRVAVLETRGVQVVVVRMDTSGACPAHVGKAPRLVIAFRGTDNVANVMEDIRFRQRTWKEMETPTLSARASVHSGFLELWMSLKERVIDVVLTELRRQCAPAGELQTNDPAADTTDRAGDGAASGTGGSPSRADRDTFRTAIPFSAMWTSPRSSGGRGRAEAGGGDSGRQRGCREGFMRIYVTGHSLGGALASLCAYTLRRMLLFIRYPEPDLVVYTFGQPRIGNSVFKQYYNRAVPCTFRVVNESDAVSGFNFFGGHHVGVQVNIDRHGNYVCRPMYIERMFRPTRGRGFALANHTIAAYADSLNAMADVYTHGACPLRCHRPYVDVIKPVSSTDNEEEGHGAEVVMDESQQSALYIPRPLR
ncbi:hypothetical protein LSCM4_03580 [Leishmania orientalis]|uniref:Fungal lipase-type domain-containing protein n=1 Tax=Leishmania orientalis TaxID=2249476 RepID=A0A836KGS1_9TRYP|nr:hypothetical protein LSCM4_03580 [Leishmania orientalis]